MSCSTNWSNGGEGTFVVLGKPGGAGYKAQNNTQTIFTDPDSVVRFQTELVAEHLIARDQESLTATPAQRQRKIPATDANSPMAVPRAQVLARPPRAHKAIPAPVS